MRRYNVQRGCHVPINQMHLCFSIGSCVGLFFTDCSGALPPGALQHLRRLEIEMSRHPAHMRTG